MDKPLALTAGQLLLGGVMLLPVAFVVAGPPPLPQAHAWPGLIWLVLANSALAYWCWVRALSRFGPTVMSMVSLLNPVTAVLLGVMVLPERLSALQWIGMSLILLAVMLMKALPGKTGRRQGSLAAGKPGTHAAAARTAGAASPAAGRKRDTHSFSAAETKAARVEAAVVTGPAVDEGK